jgi:hypothetical protein
MVKYDQVKLPAASRNGFGNLSDSSEQTQLLQQARRHSTADVSHDDGLTRFDPKHMCRIHAHVGATDDYRLQSLQRLWKQWHGGSELFVTFQHQVKVIHIDSSCISLDASVDSIRASDKGQKNHHSCQSAGETITERECAQKRLCIGGA